LSGPSVKATTAAAVTAPEKPAASAAAANRAKES